jgi:hypothetical protein
MEKGKIKLTQKDAENTPAGGVVVGKRDGQTMIYDDASLGGYFVGKLHKDGGIKMVNKSTGQPLEVQGAEVIITAPAVNDQTKRQFEGKMMTNREILSKINSDGGGVSFADGGDIPAKIHTTDCEYKFGGKVVKDTDIAHSLGMNSTLKKGKQQFSSGDTTYDVDAIYNAIKKGKLRLKTKEVETFPMKYPVYDKNYAENHKIDFRKPNGITVRTESGEEVLIDGNHRMNNAYLNGRKTMKTYYIEDLKQISKFSKKNKFELGGENKNRVLSEDYKNKMATSTAKKEIRHHYNEPNDPFDDRKDSENWRKYALPYDTRFDIEFKKGGHLSKGKSLKQIAEMHNVTLTHINEELAKGLEVEKEHFVDFKERTRVAKDHLVENPNYYTILEKAGLKMGGHIQRQELVEKSKKGDTPARDLNNYNDVLDLQADAMVGEDSGLAFAKGGLVTKDNLKNIEKEFLSFTNNSNYKGIYDEDEIDYGVALEWGKYGYSVSEEQQNEDYQMLINASSKFNAKNIGKLYANAEFGDKYNTVTIFDYDMLANDRELVSRLPEKYFAKLKVGRGNNTNVAERLKEEVNKLKDLEAVGVISKKLDINQEKAKEIVDSLQYDKEYYEKNKTNKNARFDVFYMQKLPRKEFKDFEETINFIQTDEFINSIYNSATPRIEVVVNLYGWGVLTIKYDEDSRPYKPDGSTDWNSRGRTLDMYPYIATNISGKQDFINSLQKGISDFIWCYKYYVIGADNKKNIEEVEDLSDLLEMVKSGDYANGGITPYDANVEGDSVDIIESEFAKGGVVYDTTKPKIEKITIKDTKFDRISVVGRNASTISEFQQIVSDYIGNTPKENIDWISFYVNDNTRGSYYIDLNKGKKNTVKNVNPETLNSLNFRRVIDANKYLVKNYDWTDFFELGSKKATSIDNYVKKIQVAYESKTKYPPNGIANKVNTLELYDFLRGLSNGNYKNIKIQPIGKNNYEYGFLSLDITTNSWNNILFNSPEETALKEINRILYELYPQLNFDDFVKVNSNYTTSTPASNAIEPKIVDAVNVEFVYPNGRIEVSATINISNLKNALANFWNIVDKKSWEVRITPFENQFTPFEEKKLIIGSDFAEFNPETFSEEQLGDKLKKLYPDLDWSIFLKEGKKQNVSPVTSTQEFDFSSTKIDVSNNPELSKKVQKKAFELGWEWENGGGKTIDYNTFNYLYFTKTSISSGNTNSSFVNSPKREITEAEIFGSQAPVLSKKDLKNTKIWIGDDVELRDKVIDKLIEIGIPIDSSIGNRNYSKNVFIYIYDKDFVVWNGEKTENFDKNSYKEIFPSDLGIGLPASTSATPTVKKPVVYQIKIYTQEKNTGDKKVSVARSFEDFFRILKGLVAINYEFEDTVALSIFTDDNDVKYTDLSFAVEKQTFDLLTDIEAKENLMDTLTANNQGLDFKEFFSKIEKKLVDYVIVKDTESFPNGQKVYTGRGLLGLFEAIYTGRTKGDIKVEVDLVVEEKAENAPLILTLKEIPTYDYEINPNDINEDELYSKLKFNWFPEYNWDKMFEPITELLVQEYQSGKEVFKTKNINELFEKLNKPEFKNTNNEIRLSWINEFGNIIDLGFYFVDNLTLNYEIKRDDFNIEILRERLEAWFFGRLSENYMYPDGKFKSQTPTSNSVVPKIVEQGVYNLDLAVSKLEKASSTVVTEYNKEIYDKTLKFLYDTKATYELALKFTPESAFMYERLDIMKKLADIEKQIKNIEDMKKGGTFYMLAKILEKLERGENWRQSETAEDVITNTIPQSEIDIIIRSKKFKNWFGDWEKALINDEYDNVSKALTNGIPSVYHHGARRIKYTYREVSNGVLYLAENISYATWFSQNATAQTEEGNYLTECFVNIKNPIDLTAFYVSRVDLGDIVRYVDAIYPLAKIYDFIPAQVASLIKANQPTNVVMWAWQLIRSYAKFVNHIKENTPYDGFLYYENNPSDQVINPATGQSEENVTKAVAIFKSYQVKVVDAVLFDGGLDDWRFENGGKIKN